MKKVVIFGGGTGLSQILKGLKLFPMEVTAVVGVADNGRSTGKLREEFDIPAVGDLTKVLFNMADLDEDITKLINYKFNEDSSIGAHSIKNLLLTALLDIKGSLDSSIPVLCKMFNIKGNILPLTEESVNLVAKISTGETIVGEDEITEAKKRIDEISYDKDFTVNPKIFKALKEANLIIFSSGSLYTSIIPHIIAPKMKEAIIASKAKKAYVCNLVTQPGESIDYTASKHIETLNKYFGQKTIDAIIVNSHKISKNLTKKYETREQKWPVSFDKKELEKLGIDILGDKLYLIENGVIRHDSLKAAYLIFSYLMRS